MNNPIYYFFYLAGKHFNIFMAIQISKLIGVSLYDSIMRSVKKKVCVWWNDNYVYHTFLHVCHNIINLCFYNADKVKIVCLTHIIIFCCIVLLFSLNKQMPILYLLPLISLTLNWQYPFLTPTCMSARRHQKYLISILHQVIRILCNPSCVFNPDLDLWFMRQSCVFDVCDTFKQ